ncbi:Fic family protein [Candidatus Uhrbacteria bacterium UHB]|nr:Fic family protein [Anaerolineales bacterium]MDL1953002.1 Fic family protein [Candidatus Uhrbacteria bacterium UHB]RIL00211.1 MAG: hypothetical protein DCC77_04990 [Candidatus Uhrbacteria bacterium]
MRFEVTPEAPRKETLPQKEQKAASRESKAVEREALLEILEKEELDPKVALEIIAAYGEEPDAETRKDLNAVLSAYGLHEDDMTESERKKTTAVFMAATRESSKKEDLEASLASQLTLKAFQKMDTLQKAFESIKTPEEKKAALRELMDTMSHMAKLISIESEDDMALWDAFYERFRAIGESKKTSPEDVKKTYDEVFKEFEEVIEVDIYRRRKRVSDMRNEFLPEDELMSELYGRTSQELEALKMQNRKNVAEFIRKHSDREPSIELLEELHRINNKGIVAREISTIRHTRDQQVVYGGGRVGTFGEDVPEEMGHLMARAEWLVANNPNKLRYEVSVAKLHNDLLNIHPFSDRNGSTAMLFAEFLMAKKGYTPDTKRDASYYNYVRKTLGNNPVAVAVLGGGMYEIGERSGYFKGMTAKGKEKAYDDYFQHLYDTLGAK